MIQFFAEDLKKMPAPEVAVNYYMGGDMYLFGKPLSLRQWFHIEEKS